VVTPAANARPFRFQNFDAGSSQQLRDMTDVWLADVSAAAWVTKEAQKLAGVIAEYLLVEKPMAVYTRDFESKYNIQSEEVARGLKLLKLFAAVEGFEIEKGKLYVLARVTLGQRVKYMELQERYRQLAAVEADRTASEAVEALRSVAAHTVPPVNSFADASAPLAANG
jgi:hypothetical protein